MGRFALEHGPTAPARSCATVGLHRQRVLVRVIQHREQAPPAHQLRTQELQDEALIAVFGPRGLPGAERVRIAGDVGEPASVFFRGGFADALEILQDAEAERVGVDAREAAVVEVRLEDHVGVRVQEFHEGAIGDLPRLVEPGHDRAVHRGGAALFHHPGLPLR